MISWERPLYRDLTGRQQQVIELRADGRTFQEIADELGISVGFAQKTMFEARIRLGARTTAQAMAEAVRRGIVQ